jgi:hypothetical protein
LGKRQQNNYQCFQKYDEHRQYATEKYSEARKKPVVKGKLF